MGRGHVLRSFKAVAKPACFVLVLALLVIFSRLTVPYVVYAGGASGLPANLEGKVIITGFDGQTLTSPQDISTEDPAQPVNFNTWNQTTDQMVVQPDTSESSGCSTIYNTVLTVDVSTANELHTAMNIVMNVSVTDQSTGKLLASNLVPVDFKPGQANMIETTFSLETDEVNPVLIVSAAFPSAEELQSAPATILHIPLFQYILMKAGMMSNSMV